MSACNVVPVPDASTTRRTGSGTFTHITQCTRWVEAHLVHDQTTKLAGERGLVLVVGLIVGFILVPVVALAVRAALPSPDQGAPRRREQFDRADREPSPQGQSSDEDQRHDGDFSGDGDTQLPRRG